MSVTVLHGDCREVLTTLPAESVHCVVTSPPYFGLRDYGVAGQIGLEATPDAYVQELVGVFREVRRVLRSDGTLWLNLGDSYAAQRGGTHQPAETLAGGVNGKTADGERVNRDRHDGYNPTRFASRIGLKHKDLIGIPWRVAFALQADGWYLRQDIIWSKPNPMPESVRDRCTKAHEYLFLLSKSARYFYDADAIAEQAICGTDMGLLRGKATADGAWVAGNAPSIRTRQEAGVDSRTAGDGTRNARSVWTIASQPFAEAHFATFPPDLAERCIKAGTSEKGCCPTCGAPWERVTERTPMVLDRSERTHGRGRTRSSGTMLEPPRSETLGWQPSCVCPAHEPVPCTVLDPFGGAGTTGLVADRLQRNAILIELNPEYAAMAERRIRQDAPLFAGAA